MNAPLGPPGHGDEQVDALLCLARGAVDEPALCRLRASLRPSFDWDRLFRLAMSHQVAPLVATQVSTVLGDQCPSPVLQRARAILRLGTVRGLALEEELASLIGLFERNGVHALAYKGPVLAAAVYGRPGSRIYGDLDVLVSPWDYHFGVQDLLLGEGWTCGQRLSFERTFQHAGRDLSVDVHLRFAPEDSMPIALDHELLYPRGEAVIIGGRQVRTLGRSDLLLVLCVQLAKDVMDEERATPLLKVCDIAETLRTAPDAVWDATIALAEARGLSRILDVGVRVASDLLRAPVPTGLRQRIDTAEVSRLGCHVAERVLGAPLRGFSSPELLDRAKWHRALRERWQDRWRTSLAPLRYVFAPNAADYEWVRLSRGRFRLYFLVRPMRIAAKPLLRLAFRRAPRLSGRA